jgi:hypothetical protein
MSHDAVYWGVIIAVIGAVTVAGWLFFLIYTRAKKGSN